MFWFDDHRVIMSVRDLPNGWQAQRDEASKVILIDTASGALEETQYRGSVECFADGTIVLESRLAGVSSLASGKFGDPLASLKMPGNFLPSIGIPGTSCVPFTYQDGFLVVRLRPGDGYVKRSTDDLKQQYPRRVLLVEDAKSRQLAQVDIKNSLAPIDISFTYLTYLESYFMPGATGHGFGDGGILFASDGTYTRVPNDPFMSELEHHMQGNAVWWLGQSRAQLWFFRAYAAYWRKTGLYLIAHGQRVRIDDQDLREAAGFASDGCRFFYERLVPQKQLREPPRTPEFAIQNVCTIGSAL